MRQNEYLAGKGLNRDKMNWLSLKSYNSLWEKEENPSSLKSSIRGMGF